MAKKVNDAEIRHSSIIQHQQVLSDTHKDKLHAKWHEREQKLRAELIAEHQRLMNERTMIDRQEQQELQY